MLRMRSMENCDQYEYSDEKSIDPELICIICSKPLSDPLCSPCDHIFCRECITKWIETRDASCATCRECVLITDFKPANRVVRNMLGRLRVTCLICGHIGLERDNFQNHIDQLCPETHIPCSAADINCPWTGKRSQLDDHLTSCVFNSYRPVIIPFVTENTQLKEQIANYTTQINELQAEQHRQKVENERLTQRSAQYQTRIQELTGKVNELTPYTNSKLKEQIATCEPFTGLDLSDQFLTDLDMSMIVSEAMIIKKCKALCLRNNEITANGVSFLADILQNNITLETLSLSNNSVADKGILLLSQALIINITRLKELDLTSNGITDKGAQYLAHALTKNTSLIHLWLDNNNIGDPGVQVLAKAIAECKSKIQHLSFDHNKSISDSSVNHLATMLCQRKSILKTLRVRYCSFSESGKEKLRNGRPDSCSCELYI